MLNGHRLVRYTDIMWKEPWDLGLDGLRLIITHHSAVSDLSMKSMLPVTLQGRLGKMVEPWCMLGSLYITQSWPVHEFENHTTDSNIESRG